jgi:hypothetical protein
VHVDDPAAGYPAGAVGLLQERGHATPLPSGRKRPRDYRDTNRSSRDLASSARNKRGKHSIRRLHLGRLVMCFVIAAMASAGVALASPRLMPTEPAEMMADPAFDVKAFYATHPNVESYQKTAYAFTPGLPQGPKPIAGLSQTATNNAYIVIEVGKSMKLPKRAYVIAIATALQETFLKNLANSRVPASLKLPHEGVGSNFDSLGLFQQRPSQGWGTAAQLMDPAQAAARLYSKLMRIDGWEDLSVAGAAQAVQRSAFPSAYAKHVDRAEEIVAKMPSYS